MVPGWQLAGQHAVVEEGRAVCIVAERALFDVLHDRVLRHPLLHLELRGGASRNLAHKIDDSGGCAGGIQFEVVPWRYWRYAVCTDKVCSERSFAEGSLGGDAHIGSDSEATELLRVGDPIARFLSDVCAR